MGSAKAPPPLDLRSVSLLADKCIGTVKVERTRDNWSEWLQFGQASLYRSYDEDHWLLMVYSSDDVVVGPEHSQVTLVSLPLIGVSFRWCDRHWTRLSAYIDPDDDDKGNNFRVPGTATYDPRTHPKSRPCKIDTCARTTPHILVPEEVQTPPFDATIFEAVRGRRVQIILGVNFEGRPL